jgi:outer membrane cobalamin receptor
MIPKLFCAMLLLTTQFAKSQDTVLPAQRFLDEVVVTANREGVKRSQAPVAITSISSKTIRDAKAISIDQLLNKVSGVNMVNLPGCKSRE